MLVDAVSEIKSTSARIIIIWLSVPVFLIIALGSYEKTLQKTARPAALYIADDWGMEEELPQSSVTTVVQTRDSYLWLGTSGGLAKFRAGEFTVFDSKGGLPNGCVWSLLADEGGIWLGTWNGGLTRFADGKFTTYDVSNSNISNNVVLALHKTRDGRLWFPTVKGAVVIDPGLIKTNELPPPVVIESVLANKNLVERPAKIEMPPGNTDLEVQYTGLSFVAPEKVRFKYKLEGYDDDWTEAGARRTAYYTNIPPGKYQFRVIAANNDGIWNTEGAMLEVVAMPPFYRTWWFYALTILALGVVVYSLYKFRISRLERAPRIQEAFSQQLMASQESERRRIAAELHDSLEQNLLIIKNRALIGANKVANTDAVLKQLDEISSTASYAIEEVRTIAHNLHPYQLERLGLTSALESVIEKVSDSAAIRFSLEIDSVDNLFSPEEEINIYRIVQESLNNIIRHSGATKAKVFIKRDRQRLNLQIEDNGKGFDAHAATIDLNRTGGLGLQDITERTRMLGGKCAIHSVPNGGTSIVINIAPRTATGKTL